MPTPDDLLGQEPTGLAEDLLQQLHQTRAWLGAVVRTCSLAAEELLLLRTELRRTRAELRETRARLRRLRARAQDVMEAWALGPPAAARLPGQLRALGAELHKPPGVIAEEDPESGDDEDDDMTWRKR